MPKKIKTRPAQHQRKQPGIESKMVPEPKVISPDYEGSHKLKNKTALITGGDSGIGRAVACAFAREGADIIVHYLNEHEDAKKTKQMVEKIGRRCLLIAKNLKTYPACEAVVKKALKFSPHIDILVNNIAEQHPKKKFEEISCEQFENTFKTNIFSYFYMTKALMPQFKKGDVIINSASVTAYHGNAELIDYSATKGAIISFTRSLSTHLVEKGIRVNAVAPGPVWTPLIPSTFSAKKVSEFGGHVPMKRPGEPYEIAPSYVFLASQDSSYMTGQVLHPNGGVMVES